MGQVAVVINGRNYPVVCEDGQEEHVTRLAAYLDKRASELAATVGPVGEGRLLIMTGLLVADELSDAYDEVERLQQEAKRGEAALKARAARELEEKFAPLVNGLADRIEHIAARLESD